ncbi:MAG: hypothetical protein WCI77_03960 [Candidatus Omnitrophota bacterium]
MEKTISVTVKIVGWLTAIMGFVFVFAQFSSSCEISEAAQRISRIFVICPIEFIDQGAYIGIHMAITALVVYIICFLNIGLGVWLLRFKNIARLLIVFISLIQVLGIISFGYLDYRAYGEPVMLKGSKLDFIVITLSFIVHIFYIYFFTRKKIKEKFT